MKPQASPGSVQSCRTEIPGQLVLRVLLTWGKRFRYAWRCKRDPGRGACDKRRVCHLCCGL